MTGRPHAWLRWRISSQACYHCSQSGAGATLSIERLLCALESLGIVTAPLRQLPLKALQRMITASRYPDGDEAPVDLFDERDGALALEVAQAVVGFADQQLADLMPSEST